MLCASISQTLLARTTFSHGENKENATVPTGDAPAQQAPHSTAHVCVSHARPVPQRMSLSCSVPVFTCLLCRGWALPGNTHTLTQTCSRIPAHTHVCVHMRARVCTCTQSCMHMQSRAYLHTISCMCTHTVTYVCTHTHACAHSTCTCTHTTCVYTYAHSHMHMHTVACMCTQSRMCAVPHTQVTHRCALSHMHAHTHSHMHVHSCTVTHARAHAAHAHVGTCSMSPAGALGTVCIRWRGRRQLASGPGQLCSLGL